MMHPIRFSRKFHDDYSHQVRPPFILPPPPSSVPTHVHSSVFLSPHKLSLLILIQYYYSSFPTIPELLAILTSSLQNELNGQWPEPPLYQLLHQVKDIIFITTVDNNAENDNFIRTKPVSLGLLLWERIQDVKTPDDLFLMADAWKSMIKDIDQDAADYDDGIVIDRVSPLGEFIRRACLEHSSMPFEEHAWLYSTFLDYVKVSKDRIPIFATPNNTITTKPIQKLKRKQSGNFPLVNQPSSPADDNHPMISRHPVYLQRTPSDHPPLDIPVSNALVASPSSPIATENIPAPLSPDLPGEPIFRTTRWEEYSPRSPAYPPETPVNSIAAPARSGHVTTSTARNYQPSPEGLDPSYSRTVDPDTPVYTRTVDPITPVYTRNVDPHTPAYIRETDPNTPMHVSDTDPDAQMDDTPTSIPLKVSFTIKAMKSITKKKQTQLIPEGDGVMKALNTLLPKAQAFIPNYNSHRFIESQIEVLRLARAPNVPFDLQKIMEQTMAAAGGYAESHLLSFLNYMRLGEYEGAAMNLHRFHDQYVGAQDQASMSQIALLNRAALHLRFHGKQEAILDIYEAVNRSREQGNKLTLSFSLRWLDQLTCASLPSTKPNMLITHEAIPSESMSTLSDLEAACNAVREGKTPLEAFGHMTRAIAIQLELDRERSGKAEPQGFGVIHHVESTLWDSYGNYPMANLCNEVELFQHRDANKFEGQVIAKCRFAKKCAENGRYEEAFRALKEIEPWCSLPLMDLTSAWLECKTSIEFQGAYFAGDWSLAESRSNRLNEVNWFDTKALARISFLRQLVESRKGNPTAAYHEIARLIGKTPLTESDGSVLNYLMALADIHLNLCLPLTALNVILSTLTLSQQLAAQQQYHGALLRLVDVLLHLDLPFQALQVSRYVLPRILGCGDLHLEGIARMTYGRAVFAVICNEREAASVSNDSSRDFDREQEVDEDTDDACRLENDLNMAMNQFKFAIDCFRSMKDVMMEGKCLYIFARILDVAGQTSERDRVASEVITLMGAL